MGAHLEFSTPPPPKHYLMLEGETPNAIKKYFRVYKICAKARFTILSR